MAVAIVCVIFIVIGAGVIFVAFSGGPAAARERYLTRGRRGYRIVIPILYLVLGIGIPVLVITSRPTAEGATGVLRGKSAPTSEFKRGQTAFKQNCATCHSLAAANAIGVTGPNLDQIGQVNEARVLSALRVGGTGDGRMPSNILQGEDAKAVAYYVSQVAGR